MDGQFLELEMRSAKVHCMPRRVMSCYKCMDTLHRSRKQIYAFVADACLHPHLIVLTPKSILYVSRN